MKKTATIEELKEALSAGRVGLSFLEKVILALIDGYGEIPIKNRKQRLKDAIKAITGHHPKHGSKIKEDRQMLLYMASQWMKKKQTFSAIKIGQAFAGEDESALPYENLTELARLTLKRFNNWDNMATGRAQTKRLMDKFKKDKNKLIQELHYADNQVHILEHLILERLKEEIELANTPFKIPETPTAFYTKGKFF